VPEKSELVWGEPAQAAFTVVNVGPTNFGFSFGGDYRGTGRHNRFKISITNSNGEALADPIARVFEGAGFLQPVNLQPGQSFANLIDLTSFRVIDKPGIYRVNCSFAFDEPWVRQERTNPVVIPGSP